MSTLEDINQLPLKGFIEVTSPLLEHCGWALPNLASSRPFSSVDEMQKKLALILQQASKEKQLDALIQHPKLGVGKAQPGFSQGEQQQAGLTQLSEEEMALFAELNERYEEEMGFPFVIAVSGLNKSQILSAMQSRMENDRHTEFQTALQELIKIAQLRVQKIID